jgi:hypothetical protein
MTRRGLRPQPTTQGTTNNPNDANEEKSIVTCLTGIVDRKIVDRKMKGRASAIIFLSTYLSVPFSFRYSSYSTHSWFRISLSDLKIFVGREEKNC